MSDGSDGRGVDHELLLKEVSALATQFDILRFLKKVTEQFEMRVFMVVRAPGPTTSAIQAASVITSWPAELITKYDQEGLLPNSLAMQHIKTSSLPLPVDVETLKRDPLDNKRERMIELFRQYHLPRGAVFPVSDPTGDRGGVSFLGDRCGLSSYEILQLFMISTYVFERLYHISRRDQKIGEDLTQREIDCLNWTAAGKTSLEISNILSLSEHTVNHYLNRATKKLDTVNRTQAVAKALRMGIIV